MTTTTIDKEKIQELIKKYQEHIEVLECRKPEDVPKHLQSLATSFAGMAFSLRLIIKDLEELLK